MPSFGTVALPNINPLADFYASGNASNAVAAGQLANQGTQQTLTDRATLRDLAPGLAANDPGATATALTLPGVGGTSTAAGLAGMHTDQRAQLGNTLAVTGALSGAILAAPPDQRAALWTQMRPSMVQSGAVQAPEQYPGDDFLAAHRTAALDAQQQIATLATVPTTDPTRTPLSAPAGPGVGPGGVVQGQSPGFTGQMGAAEAPTPSTVNPGGYSGQFQFGAARLADPGVGVYTPAHGENLNANTWQGTFNIPGFPDVKTHAQFLASPGAQKAVFATHVADIDGAIAQTPGAAGLNQNGLRAVAHLGGVAGMQKFVATGGAYNPPDANGTRLSDYYTKFSQGGPRALQASFGHPDGPPAAQGVDLTQPAPAPPVAGVQYATRGPVPGDTATDASPAPAAPPVGTQGADAVLAGLRAQVPNQNALLPVATPDAGAPAPQNQLMPAASAGEPAPVNQLMPAASASPPAGAAPAGAPAPPAGQILYRGGLPIPASVPGYVQTRNPDGSVGMVRLPGAPPKIKSTPVGGQMINTDENTGQEVGRFPIPDASRSIPVQVPGGTQLYQAGHAVGPVIPFSGREQQNEAYKADQSRVADLTSSAQSAQASMPRLNEMASLAGQLSTGPTAETRAKAAAMLQTLGAPDAAVKTLIGTPDASLAQEFIKLSIATAGSAAKADVGSNNGIQSTQLYQAANPNLGLLPDANKRITNMMRVSAQSIQDYAQAALDHFGTNEAQFLHGGDYAPLTTFNRQWQAQANPQVYAAATGILNGDPFDKWSSKITPAEGARAAQIASRVDPTAQVPLKGGGTRPVSQILAHPSISPAAN